MNKVNWKWQQSYKQSKLIMTKYMNKIKFMTKWKCFMNTSIPVHLYICVWVYQSTCIPVTPKASVYQSTCIPVTQKPSIPVHLYTSHENTSIPVCQYTSPAAVTTLPPLDVSALRVVAPSSRCLWVVAPSSRCHLHVDHICPSRPGVKLGPKDHYHTALVKYRASRITLLPCLVKIPGL